ncbi:AP-1 complex subunit sigma-2 isoform X2 [Rissa tridactyla]|uniref:AP-1 complex subunit sigma-2 isoform X2 n=1 Tax=Rissa tridactyla TaxID=75485 RepID=UPI0023BA3F38|nr:AP-1 complex subunit sigma-2 isoform X2 [Rissa tridactyla]
MQFMLLFSRQGKLRLQKWYVPLSDKEKKKITRELVQTVLARKPKMCSFLEWRDLKIVYKRYASLYFCCAIEDQDNELITLEIIHRYVELLDKYFGSVCELDIIFNFEKAYFILDEFLLGGEVQETSKKNVLKAIEQADLLQELCKREHDRRLQAKECAKECVQPGIISEHNNNECHVMNTLMSQYTKWLHSSCMQNFRGDRPVTYS